MPRLDTTIALTVYAQSLSWVTLGPHNVVIEQGLSAVVPLTLRNDGQNPVTYTFVSDAPDGSGIVVALEDGTYVRTVAPGAEDLLRISIAVPMAAAPGPYVIGIALN